MTKIYVYPADQWACGHYRLIWPAQALDAQHDDLDITIAGIGEELAPELRLSGRTDQHGHLIDISYPDDADIIVLQRPTHKYLAQGVKFMVDRGLHVVVDMDDDLSKIHPANPAFTHLHPKTGDPDHSWHNVEYACRHASTVTVSTPGLLAKYASHGRGIVVPNAVPAEYLDIERVDEGPITWCGSLHSHPDDLRQVGTAFLDLHRSGVRVGCVGGGEGVVRALGLNFGDLEISGVVPIEQWPHAVAKSLASVTPLADTHFNTCKSWLKPLEAMACGVPVVMSPGNEYARLHELTGVGFLASKPKFFTSHLRKLAASADLRAEQSGRGREVVRANHTIEGQAHRWLEAWTATFVASRGMVTA